MVVRNKVALPIIMFSLVCLYPGLTKPMMNIRAGTELPLIGELTLYNETQSIIQTIAALADKDNTLVAVLILLFSVVIPLLKAILLMAVLLCPRLQLRQQLYNFVALIGKWSMADVFVVAIFIAFLATRSNPHIHATLHDGFYYFTAYCVLSMLGIQVMTVKGHPAQPGPAKCVRLP